MVSNRFPESNLSLCVYCGSGEGRSPSYMQAARDLGSSMAENNVGLVYGGGGIGLMGEVARTVIAGNAHVTGIIPKFLMKRERMLEDGGHELFIVDDMHERKMMMFERASGFVALPGGIGTLEELVEIATWAQLGRHKKPIIVANIDNYWQPLLTLVSHMKEELFIREGLEVHFEVVDRAKDIVPAFLDRLATAGTAPEDSEITELF
ncbi:TIGR00730 family Rossman fold protein [Anderseniella sp. Alg231-50]|uniref:TIGR00730 family Rossman fold protein n=1 Tax=Anderseniella sp. Alg231-50 TaxID=1922226 RepID=UPI000D55CA4C